MLDWIVEFEAAFSISRGARIPHANPMLSQEIRVPVPLGPRAYDVRVTSGDHGGCGSLPARAGCDLGRPGVLIRADRHRPQCRWTGLPAGLPRRPRPRRHRGPSRGAARRRADQVPGVGRHAL